eukprot:7644123-Heterocapsa_arctica.AAC.1
MFCSDSSAAGYALHESTATSDEVLEAIGWRERWRFAPVHEPAPDRLPDGVHGAQAGHVGLAPVFEAWMDAELEAAPAPAVPGRIAG